MCVLVALSALIAALLLTGCSGGSDSRSEAAEPAPPALPAPEQPISREPVRLARSLASTTTELRAAIDRWRSAGNPRRGGPPRDVTPAGTLLDHYRKAQRRYRVPWQVLAAVNFVETGFNRLRSNSTAGAQGPMQFIPATWRAYGRGGDIHDPHDAILGAANYLRASGAPRNLGRALYAYNRSSLYVEAVLA